MTNRRTLEIEGHTTSTAHRLLHYEGVCNNLHGHNMEWNAELEVVVHDAETWMAEDFKDVSDIFDKFDHATLLNMADPIYKEYDFVFDSQASDYVYVDHPLIGDTYAFHGDPTCEFISQVVAEELNRLDNVVNARVQLKETDKYAMTAAYPDRHA